MLNVCPDAAESGIFRSDYTINTGEWQNENHIKPQTWIVEEENIVWYNIMDYGSTSGRIKGIKNGFGGKLK